MATHNLWNRKAPACDRGSLKLRTERDPYWVSARAIMSSTRPKASTKRLVFPDSSSLPSALDWPTH